LISSWGAPEGQHAVLNSRKELSQPGQFVSDVRLDLVGPVNPKTGKNKVIAGVSILGPLRDHNQVEISATDARTLGVAAPIRLIGRHQGFGSDRYQLTRSTAKSSILAKARLWLNATSI
jgi:propanediol utilization protein